MARLTLSGATPLAWRLRSDADTLEEEARRISADLGRTWLDKIELRCSEPRAETAPSADPVAELRLLMETEVAQSKAFRDELQAIAEELRGHLPPGSREDLFGADAEAFAEALSVLAAEGAEDVLAHLRAADADVAP